MSFYPRPLTPSQSLPPVRTLATTSECQIIAALRNLQTIYCPLRLPIAFTPRDKPGKLLSSYDYSTPVNDSGYASGDEEDDSGEDNDRRDLASLRADEFERSFAQRWLTALVSRVESFAFDDDTSASIIDDAAFVLASFSDSTAVDTDLTLTRDFEFPVSAAQGVEATEHVCVRLDDAPLSGSDHTDVGLQSWGASIILSGLLCADPARFGLDTLQPHCQIVELGAGTGLVSLTLAGLVPLPGNAAPKIVATDYHLAVLENLRRNITLNVASHAEHACPVETALLDWSEPLLTDSLNPQSEILFAADVVYAPEHAAWLRDCAARMLSSTGTFWLIVTVRTEGKFRGIVDTVEAAFALDERPHGVDGQVLDIIDKQFLDKKRGIGRGDESGYVLYRIGWSTDEAALSSQK